MKLQVTVKRAYGKVWIYPACTKSELICNMLGTTTIPQPAVEILKQLGFEFTNVLQPQSSLI